MLSGSDKLKNALADYAELADKQNEKKSGRKLSNELALQQEANKGQADVANIRNTGAMDVQKSSEGSAKELLQSKLTSEQPVQSAQARYLGAHADLYEAQAGVVGQQKGALAKQEEAKAALYGAQAENQSLTNTLAKKYGEQKVQNELSLQSAGTEKIGMELDLLKQDYDKTQNDAAMKRSAEYVTANGGVKTSAVQATPNVAKPLPSSYREILTEAGNMPPISEDEKRDLGRRFTPLTGSASVIGKLGTGAYMGAARAVTKGAAPGRGVIAALMGKGITNTSDEIAKEKERNKRLAKPQ